MSRYIDKHTHAYIYIWIDRKYLYNALMAQVLLLGFLVVDQFGHPLNIKSPMVWSQRGGFMPQLTVVESYRGSSSNQT